MRHLLRDTLIISRWPNLLITFFVQLIYYLLFLRPFISATQNPLQIHYRHFLMITFGSLAVMAAANIQNAWTDVKTDQINRPERVTRITARKPGYWTSLYYGFNLFASILAICVAWDSGHWSLIPAMLLPIPLLFLYTLVFQHSILWGNFLISLLCAWVPGIYLFAEWQTFTLFTHGQQLLVISLPVFAFLSTFLREILKDVADITGDSSNGSRTYPVVYGEASAFQFSSFLMLIFMLVITGWCILVILWSDILWLTGTIFGILLILPLIWLIFQLKQDFVKKKLARINFLLKIYMLWGLIILSLMSTLLK